MKGCSKNKKSFLHLHSAIRRLVCRNSSPTLFVPWIKWGGTPSLFSFAWASDQKWNISCVKYPNFDSRNHKSPSRGKFEYFRGLSRNYNWKSITCTECCQMAIKLHFASWWEPHFWERDHPSLFKVSCDRLFFTELAYARITICASNNLKWNWKTTRKTE